MLTGPTYANCGEQEAGKTMKLQRQVRACFLLVLAIPLPVCSVFADTRSSTARATLEEVSVRARRRQENLQTIPVATTAITAITLQRIGTDNVAQADVLVPNAIFDNAAPIAGGGSVAAFYLRGVGQSDFLLTNDPGVGIYLDGVYVSRTVASAVAMLDVSQVEVLRGPQGTLFGKNTIGGAVQILSHKPGRARGSELALIGGGDQRRNIELLVDAPLVDNSWYSRWAFAQRRIDGYGERLIGGESLGDEDRLLGRGTVQWLASDSVSVEMVVDATRIRENSPPATLVADSAEQMDALIEDSALSSLYNAVAAPIVEVPGFGTGIDYDSRFLTDSPYQTYATGPQGSEVDEYGLATTVRWQAGAIHWLAIIAYRDLAATFGRDPDHSPLAIADSRNRIEHHQISQELRANGQIGRLDWLLGAYYLKEKGSDATNGAAVPDLYDLIGLDLTIDGGYRVDNSSAALFGHGIYTVDENWSLFMGLRWTEDRKGFNSEQQLMRLGVSLLPEGWFETREQNWSPSAGIEFTISDTAMLYLSYAQSYKAGGFVGRTIQPQSTPPVEFKPETLASYELGYKAQWLKRWRLNAAVFHAQYDDVQVVVIDGNVPVTRNAAEARLTGAELEATLLLSAQWQAGVALGYLDAGYAEVDPATGIDSNARLVNAPRWTATLSLGQERTLGEFGDWAWRVDYQWRSEWANDAINTPVLLQDSVGLLNAYTEWQLPGDRWSLAVYCLNVDDHRYIVTGTSDYASFGVAEATYSRGREWGVELRLKTF